MTIVLLPFTTVLIARHGDERAMALIHIANVAVSSALLGVLSLVMFKNPQLQTSDSNIDLAYVKGE